MKSIIETEIFGEKELRLFRDATRIVDALPDRDPSGELLRCHEVSRVVGEVLGLEVLDGRYEYGHEHSWCVITRVKYRGFTILDAYAIGRTPPVQLVCVIPSLPTRYFPEARRTDIRQNVIKHLLQLPGVRDGRQEGLAVQVPSCREAANRD